MGDEINQSSELTDHEAELYDRQIRLWGLESQKRLRSAKILLIGLNGFMAETAKNIILAGVKSVTFLDHRDSTKVDTSSQFFIPRDQIGKNRAQASLERAQNLNPMVIVSAESDSIDDKPDDYLKDFDVVCASQCTISQLNRLNTVCRKQNIKFFAGDVWGTFGYTFADLNTHEFAEDVVQTKQVQPPAGGDPLAKKKFESVTVTVKRTETFVPFEEILNASKIPSRDSEMYYMMLIMLNYREKHGKDPLPSERNNDNLKTEAAAVIEKYNLEDKINSFVEGDIYAQVSPVCAIVGGVMGQEIIKTVSQKGAPHNNLFLFNPDTMCGSILKLEQ